MNEIGNQYDNYKLENSKGTFYSNLKTQIAKMNSIPKKKKKRKEKERGDRKMTTMEEHINAPSAGNLIYLIRPYTPT